MYNIFDMQGIQPELRRALGTLGGLAIPFGTPVNAAASTVTLTVAELAIINVGDTVSVDDEEFARAAIAAGDEWADAATLAALIDDVDGWAADDDTGKVVIKRATRGVAEDGSVVTIKILEDTTAGGGPTDKSTATITKETIAQLKIGDTVSFADRVFTKAKATKLDANEFADQAGLILCIDGLADWTAVNDAGDIDIEAAEDGTDFDGYEINVELTRVTAGGVDGTPGYRGVVCCDAGFIYVCTATDTTIQNNNWERAAIAAF